MYIYKGEIIAAITIFCILWAIIPWVPLTVFEGVVAGFSLVCISIGAVALAEQFAGWVVDELKGGRA